MVVTLIDVVECSKEVLTMPLFEFNVTVNNHVDTDTILQLLREVKQSMANQEARLQAISAALDNVQKGLDDIQAALAALKEDNPALDDEISAIEAKVAALSTDVGSVTP